MPEGSVVLRDQAVALARVEELVDAELWRVDRRAAALTVLRGLVCGMAWDTGLVAGVTRAHLAAAAGCSVRTVSRIVAWAAEAGLLVCVETGATAEFLGTDTNRAPSYVLTAPPSAVPGDTSGNLPAGSGEQKSPRRDRGLEDRHDEDPWPVYDRATTPAERTQAVGTLLQRAGIGGRVVRWRAVAMLGPWFEAGWSVMGLLHALDHHPDRPGASRGDAARSARDPLRVLGHRLSPWRGRLAEVPATMAAVDGHVRRTRVAALAETDAVIGQRPPATWPTRRADVATAAVRAAAQAEIGRTLRTRQGSRSRVRSTRH